MMAEASFQRGGTEVEELAVANDQNGTVTVFQGTTPIYQLSGLNHPEAVALSDINNDGVPDLIIADSGDNKVFVYAGLASGGIGAELNAGAGISVGTDPVNLSVADINHDGRADLIVTNRGSNDISILTGLGTGANWRLVAAQTIQAGIEPVRAKVVATGETPGSFALLVCNSASDNVFAYPISGTGWVAPQPNLIVPVGPKPVDMVVGQFGRRPESDLVTINADSGSMTFVGGVFTPHSTRQDITPAGFFPVSAVPLTTDSSGSSDLVVASNDGRLAFLQPSDSGLQLTGLVGSTGLSNITGLTSGVWTTDGLALYETSSDSDAIALLHLNLGDLALATSPALSAAPVALATTITSKAADSQFDVEIASVGGGPADLVGVLWTASNRSADADELATSGDPKVSSRPPVQGTGTTPSDLDHDPITASNRTSEADDLDLDSPSSQWTRFVIGLDAALDSFGGEMAAVAAAEPRDLDDWDDSRRLAGRGSGSDLPLDSFEIPSAGFDSPLYQPVPIKLDQDRTSALLLERGNGRDGSTTQTSELIVGAVGSAVAIRLLIRTSPPRPVRFRLARRPVDAVETWPEVFPPEADAS